MISNLLELLILLWMIAIMVLIVSGGLMGIRYKHLERMEEMYYEYEMKRPRPQGPFSKINGIISNAETSEVLRKATDPRS